MRNCYITVLLLVFCTAFSQHITVRGWVKDAVTNEPVISASVGIANSGMGTITNEDGVFQLSANPSATIVISYLGYTTLKMAASEFGSETKTIALEQNEEILEEVMVTKIPLHQVLQDVVTASKARFNKPIVLHAYYREFSKSDDKYNHFADGMLDYHVKGSTKKTDSEVIVNQNRSVSLLSDEEQDEAIGSLLTVQKAIFNSYDFSFVSKYILDDKNYEDYDLQLKSRKDKDGQQLFSITFDPKAEVEKALFKGIVTYDPKTKVIYEVEMYYAPTHQQYAKSINLLLLRFSVADVKFKAAYKMSGNNYVLSYNNRYVKLKAWNKKHATVVESRSDMLITDFEKDALTYDKKAIFKKKHLYEKPSSFTDKFWLKNNAIVLTADEEQIISNLEKAEKPEPQ